MALHPQRLRWLAALTLLVALVPFARADEPAFCKYANQAGTSLCCHPALSASDLGPVLVAAREETGSACGGPYTKTSHRCDFSEERVGTKWMCPKPSLFTLPGTLPQLSATAQSPPCADCKTGYINQSVGSGTQKVGGTRIIDIYRATLSARVQSYERAHPVRIKNIKTATAAQIEASILRYGTSAKVKAALASADSESRYRRDRSDSIERTGTKAKTKATGKCYRFVKLALQRSGLANAYLEGPSASGAGGALRRQGFVNLLDNRAYRKALKNIRDTPKGAVLVYKGGPHGHIEFKVGSRGEGGYISDYYSELSRTGSGRLSGDGRTLIGVYIRP